MALTYSTPKQHETLAPEFQLPGVDGKTYSLRDFENKRALIVVFMCNHCPYVIAVQDRINTLAREYAPQGAQLIGISSNDATKYPKDGFDAMKVRAQEQGFTFPYLYDETQEVARAFGAVCTPEFYAYSQENGKFVLRYHGRLDDNWKDANAVTRRDLALALDQILAGKPGAIAEQVPSMGCSIKWFQ